MLPCLSQHWCHTHTTHFTWVLQRHIYTKYVSCLFSSPSRGHRQNRNMLDITIFVVLCCYSWLKRGVCQTVCCDASVSFTNNHKPCLKFCQWQLNDPRTSFSIVNCQGLESQGGESFCSIKLYCNKVPDGKIWPQGCDQRWSSMDKWVLSPRRLGTRSQGV